MKILYIDHPEADFLSAIVFIGLCQELGAENVIDYPYKRSYHGEVHQYPSVYDRDPGKTLWQHWQSTNAGNLGVTAPFAWMIAQPGKEWSRDEVISRVREFSLIVLASPRPYNSAALSDLIDVVGRSNLPPLVMMDGEDYEEIRWDFVEKFTPEVYFKRELVDQPRCIYYEQYVRMRNKVKILPLPLAAIRILEDYQPLDNDIVMLGGSNTPGGKQAYDDVIRGCSDKHILGQVGFSEFLTSISRSKLAVAPKGASQDSLRSWEMLGCRGPLVLVQSHTLIRSHPYIKGEHCDYFSTPEELRTKLRFYLESEKVRERIAAQGFLHTKRYHTTKVRAQYLLRESGVA